MRKLSDTLTTAAIHMTVLAENKDFITNTSNELEYLAKGTLDEEELDRQGLDELKAMLGSNGSKIGTRIN